MAVKPDDLSDHDLLVRIAERLENLCLKVDGVEGKLGKHLDRHFALTLAVVVAMIGVAVTSIWK